MPKDDEKSTVKSRKTKTKIVWDNIKVRLVSASREHPNEHNLYARLSTKEREQAIVSICGRIWARHVREKLAKDTDKRMKGEGCNIKLELSRDKPLTTHLGKTGSSS